MEALLSPSPVEQKHQREKQIFTSRQEAQVLEKRLLVSNENRTSNAAFRRVCYILHNLAQKYVVNSPATFNDYNSLLHCTKLLEELGFKPELAPGMDAAAQSVGKEVIHNSFEYRHLRNKTLASLAILADLIDRPAGTGTPEYQRGMREGYRRASDIAIMFLNDLSGGESNGT
jgi:hypothetical protein